MVPKFLEVEGPDGRIVEFPKGTDGATIDRVMRDIYSQQGQEAVSAPITSPGALSAEYGPRAQNAPAALKTTPQPMNVTGGGYGAFEPYSKPVVPADRPGIVKTALENGTAIKKAFTGENKPVEFPNAPEVTEAGVGFLESAIPSLKAGLTTDPAEKAKIIEEHFKRDSRFGGIFQDENGLPLVVWDGKPHYVNKPGFSKQDATDLIAQGTMFAPASKLVGSATTLAGRAATALPFYAATDVAQQYGTKVAGGKGAVDLEQAGTTASFGAMAEAFLPPALRATGKVLRPTASKSLPRYRPGKARDVVESDAIPLTQGQRTRDLDRIRAEEGMRQGAYGSGASGMMRNFDDAQLAAIEKRADKLVPSGFGQGKIPDTGARLQADLIEEAGKQDKAVSVAYMEAREAKAMLDPKTAVSVGKELQSIPKEMQIFSLEGMPQLQGALDKLKKFGTLAKKKTLKPVDIAQIEDFRRGLNTAISGTQGTERAALTRMKSMLDEKLDEAVTNGLFSGDENALGLLKEARDLRTRYGRLFEAGKHDPAGNAMVKILDEKQASPEQVVNFIIGAGQTQSTSQAIGLVKRIKDAFGPDSEQVQALKDALLYKAFTSLQNGEHRLARTAIAINSRNLLDFKAKYLAKELFTEGELKEIRRLTNEVARTLTPADARNPSRSAWAFLDAMQRRGLIGTLGKFTQAVPVIGATGEALENVGGAIQAGRAVSQKPLPLTTPLVTPGAAAAAQGAWELESNYRAGDK
ncbi:hypothetical protein [Hwanghaeella sp.]|uniref:hypothetical protein n=1 Tax=Hwanghaeella sp. TaxID=2605943 RepID=UPI003CCB9980